MRDGEYIVRVEERKKQEYIGREIEGGIQRKGENKRKRRELKRYKVRRGAKEKNT